MGAYIIHFDDKPWQDLDDELYYRCFEIPWFSTTKTTISRLTPYTEDSAYAHGYTEAESKYREIRDELEKQAYQKGLKDAWEAARKIGSNSMCSLKEMGFDFSRCAVADYNPSWFVVKNCSASECIEKIRKYEQENLFCVGDEFENEGGKRFVITKMDGTEIDRYIDEEGKTYCMIAKYKVIRKTGRHFPEIAEVLAKMKESDNG